MTRALPVLSCALVVLVAGAAFLGGGALPAADVASRDAAALPSGAHPGGAYVCPPGGAPQPAGGICARAFAGASDLLVEPDLAVSPLDPQVMAFAANDGQTVRAIDPLRSGKMELRTQTLALFTTTDGGATWDARDLPPPPPPPAPQDGVLLADTQLWDPTIAFGADGALQVGGVLVWQGADGSAKQKRVFHLESGDLGASWSDWHLFGRKVDRPWMAVESGGAIDLVWWETADTTLGFARSVDGGATWSPLAPDAPPVHCDFPSPPVEHGGGIVVACARDERFLVDDATPPRGLYRYDAEANRFDLAGPIPAMSIPMVLAPEDGSLVIVAGVWNVSDILMLRSLDGGATWTSLPDLGARLENAAGWWFLQSMGAKLDPWGHIHLFVRGVAAGPHQDLGPAGPFVDLPVFLAAANADEFAVAHVVLDPATGDVLSEQLMTPAVPHAPTGSPSIGPGRAGDYYGIGFAEDHAVLVWEYQRSLFLTHWMR
ncbi:MAG TPA: sialidase family protein [Candidatus Thermoplasmatota archaeon]|nr:sialidase family protein [Candidatus Thermoplasmatota archaeon]